MHHLKNATIFQYEREWIDKIVSVEYKGNKFIIVRYSS